MKASSARALDAAAMRQSIVQQLDAFLRKSRLRNVYFADSSVAPPPLAYVTHFPRLSVPLDGSHAMELPVDGRHERVAPARGEAVFVPGHAWNRPDWADPVKVLTFLFGAKQIGISLVTHEGGDESRAHAIKTSVETTHDPLCRNVLNALGALAGETRSGPLLRLLTESLLHSCHRLLRAPQAQKPRKAVRTYEMLCLYVQENFQDDLTREFMAQRFDIAPAHVSRLFRREGLMRFSDYVNLVRMNRAKFILANYRIPLKEVAASCGYADVAYFCRVFKRFTKVTPGQYRDRPK
ncbi:MAG TPA: AraC family transcriptional regulator [Bryobacteraceae bacterium]|nr:AraC family transcriptional regulator [Bryobacteraceae bacterium]